MKTEFPCPVCRSDDWEDVQTFHFHRTDHAADGCSRSDRIRQRLAELWRIFLWNAAVPKSVHFLTLNAYESLRRRVLFEVWLPDEDHIELTTRICRQCGFMAYAPRPTDEDIRDKYLFLNATQQASTTSPQPPPQSQPPPLIEYLECRRAERVYAAVRPVMPEGRLEVLDYGGASGKMLRPFLEQGDTCSLVDYDADQIEGVKKIANDLDDMPDDVKFDVIICNHVLEHVAEPLQLVQKLRRYLKEGGVIFAEVPHQILAGVRLGADPVTHVNFFSPQSFGRLFQVAGYELLDDRVQVGNYGRARLKVIWILARNSAGAESAGKPIDSFGGAEIKRLLQPGRLRLIEHMLQIHLLPRIENMLLSLGLKGKRP